MRDYDIESDLKQEKFQHLKLVQGDRGNKIKINVYEDGQPVNLTGCSITAKYKRADGQIINGSVTNISNNSFDAVIDSDITKVVGTLKMLFSIEKDDVKVSTFLLLADVREGLLENTGSSGGSTGGGEVTVDLSNYYKKNETYSKAQIDSQFKDITKKIEQGGIGGGLSNDAKTLLISILQNAIYSTDQSSNITALQSALNTDITPCTITNNLSKCTNLNTNTSIAKGSNYTATIKPNTGYTLTNAIVTITMDGNDITSSAYSNGIITINNVTGNIVITCTAIQQSTTVTTYTITNNLTNVTTNNNNTTIEEHTNYSATLTADKGYTLGKIIVIMGGNDISSTVVLDGVISIESVTGDIVITASAVITTNITSIGTFEKGTLSQSNNPITTSGNGASCITQELSVGDIIGFADETLYTKYKFAIGLRTTAGWLKDSQGNAYHTSNYTIETQGAYGIMMVGVSESASSEEKIAEINNNFGKIN